MRGSWLATLVGSALLLAPRLASAKDTWIEGKSPHFHFISNMKEKDLREVAQDFERFRAIARFAMVDADAAEPTVPLTVFALRKQKDIKALIPDAFDGKTIQIAGLFSRTPYEVQIFVQAESKDYVPYVVRHEYHHLYFDRSAPWAPLWLREGIANMWASARVEGTKLSFGFVSPNDLIEMQQAKNDILSIRELMAVDYSSPAYRQNTKGAGFYSTATMFTHFLLTHEKNGLAHMAQFNALLREGATQEAALTKVWGDLDVLQEQFSRYCYGRSFSYLTLILPMVVSEYDFSAHELSEADMTATRARLLVDGKHKDEAQKLAQEALALEPGNPIALEVSGSLALAAGKQEEAHALFDRACASANASFSAHYLAAWTAHRDEHGNWEDRARVLEDLDDALAVAPRFTSAMILKASLEMSEKPAESAKLLDTAAAIETDSPWIEIRSAKIFAKVGKTAEARKKAESATAHALRIPHAGPSNSVCWSGTLAGFADVVLPACEHAVTLAPSDWQIIDSRAVARAAVLDTAGAITDLRFVLEKTDKPDVRKSRQAWLDSLEAGKNPVDRALLDGLHDSP